jgi:tetratricopeptide (TPR) repeat protein
MRPISVVSGGGYLQKQTFELSSNVRTIMPIDSWTRGGKFAMGRLFVLMALGLLSLFGSPAAAQDFNQSARACNGGEPAYSFDQQIAGCTAVIDSKTATPADLTAAFVNRGFAYGAKQQYSRAVADFDEAIRLTPNDAAAFNDRGLAYQYLGQHARAIANYDEAIRLKPDYATAVNNRGEAEQALGRTAAAQADFAKAKALDPNIDK